MLQYRVYDRHGRLIGITDFAWPEHGVYGEFDGRVKYGRLLKPGQDPGEVVFAEKRREDLIRSATDGIMVRHTWADLHPRSEPSRKLVELAAVAALRRLTGPRETRTLRMETFRRQVRKFTG